MKLERIIPIKITKKDAEKYIQIIAQKQGFDVAKIKCLGGGSFGMAYLVKTSNDELVIKFLRATDMLDGEIASLDILSKNCPIPFPKVLFARKADNDIPLDMYAMTKVAGKNAFTSFGFLFASKKKRMQFADDVTTALHQIHEVKNDKFGSILNATYDTWLEFYRDFAITILEKARELHSNKQLSNKIMQAMEKAWACFDVIFSEEVNEACLIHGDLNLANIFIDNGKLSAFIDPLNTMYADREYDLFQLNNLTGKRFKLSQTYIEKYGASKYCKEKLAFYGLWNEVFCYITSGVLINVIMNPLVKNMNKVVKTL
ncbi:MAG: phosphotransferase [Christensenellales bacterium]